MSKSPFRGRDLKVKNAGSSGLRTPSAPVNGKFVAPFAAACLLVPYFLFLSNVSLVTYRDYPFSMDEYNYLYQARIFTTGRPYIDFKSEDAPLIESYMLHHESRLFSKYPPGFPLMLAFGVLSGYPGLVNPLISTATLAFIFLAANDLVGTKHAFLATCILASNTYFVGYAASYFSQPLSLLLTSIMVWYYVRFRKAQTSGTCLAVGAAAGALSLVRQLDMFCIFLPVGIAMSMELLGGRKPLRLAYLAFPLVLLQAAHLAYNHLLSGEYYISLYDVFDSDFQLNFPQADGLWGWLGLLLANYRLTWETYTLVNIYEAFLFKSGFFLIFFAAMGYLIAPAHIRYPLAGGFLLLTAMYSFHPFSGWPQYGARYLYVSLAAVALFAAFFIKRASEALGGTVSVSVFSVIILIQAVFTYSDLSVYGMRFEVVDSVQGGIGAKCPEKSIVVLNKHAFKTSGFLVWSDFKRNPFLNGTRLIVTAEADARDIAKARPDYPVCQYSFQGAEDGYGG
jgi:hypothetical protein